MRIVQLEGGGFHLVGSSSQGKSTLLEVAYSIFGGSIGDSFTPGWRTTDNALESLAVSHNHALLALDELSQVSRKHLYDAIYMLANGEGKRRANRRNSQQARWRLLFLSTGEVSIADKITEHGRRSYHAGQAVRIVDIPIDAGAEMGAFEELHGFAGPREFADELKQAVRDHHGVALPEFLRLFTKDRQHFVGQVKPIMDDFVKTIVPPQADGQVHRIARRFALLAAAGTIATRMGLLPWPDDFAQQAAGFNFRQWLAERGTISSLEVHRGFEAVFDFLRRFGKSRFEPIFGDDLVIANKLGYRRTERTTDGHLRTEFIIPARDFHILCNGQDKRGTLQEFKRRGMLLHNKQSLSKTVRIPELGRTIKCNVITIVSDRQTAPA